MNEYLNNLKAIESLTLTENGGVSYDTTQSKLLDLFAFGGAYRERTEEEKIKLFFDAYKEDKKNALKTLFYLRNIRGEGQGEREFFRVVLKELAMRDPEVVNNNIHNVPVFGRWDDLFCLIGTPCEEQMFLYMKLQLIDDLQAYNEAIETRTPKGISLLAKWLKSEQASSKESRDIARLTIKNFGLTPRIYRKALSILRNYIGVVERYMSTGRWDEIEFDKLPSIAGLRYSKTFFRREETKERYSEFINQPKSKVNAAVLNPVDIIKKLEKHPPEEERNALDLYWNNLKDYYDGKEDNAIAVIDVSGSMYGTPMQAAIGMGIYIAEHGKGPFANHFITFSSSPSLMEINKDDTIFDKYQTVERADWGMNTNIKKVFDLLLNAAKRTSASAGDMPKRLYIFSDMEFDNAFVTENMDEPVYRRGIKRKTKEETLSDIDNIAMEWRAQGYELPHIVYWNLNARNNLIPQTVGRVSFVSGFSLSLMESILSDKSGYDLMMKVLNNPIFDKVVV